jgi:hypothetical protein
MKNPTGRYDQYLGKIRIVLGAGEPLPLEKEIVTLEEGMKPDSLESLLDRGAKLLQGQIERLEKMAKKKALSASETRMLNECLRSISSMLRKEQESERLRRKGRDEDAETYEELKKLSKKEILDQVLPILEDLGFDTGTLTLRG